MSMYQLARTMVGCARSTGQVTNAGRSRAFRATTATRASKQLFHTATKTTVSRSHGYSLPSSSFTNASAMKCFSSSTSSGDLSTLLARELAEEEEQGALEMPPVLVDLKTELAKDWTILDDDESGTVKMYAKSGRVTVVFHCQDTLEVDFDDDDDGDEASPEVRFTLTVQKAGRTMVMNCVSVEANAVVETVAVTTEDVEKIHASGKVSDKLYQGPQFDELAEDLQEAFTQFVQTDCGVHTNVSAFISMYADFKEQEEYIRWLKQVQGILD